MAYLRVLAADRSEDDIISVMREFRRNGYEIAFRRVECLTDLTDALEAGGWNLVITDYEMPGLSGIEVVKAVRELKPGLPVLMVSGTSGEEAAVRAIKAGADDFIFKGRLSGLVPSAKKAISSAIVLNRVQAPHDRPSLVDKLFQAITEVDRMIIREVEPVRILTETCRILVERIGFSMAWIGRADFNAGVITPIAHAFCDPEYLKRLIVRCDDSPNGNGPTGTAVKTGRHVVCLDLQSDKSIAPWRGDSIKYGFKACASFPIFSGNAIFGNLSVYSADPGVLDEKTVGLIDSMADNIGLALQSLRETSERRKAALALRESEEKLRTIFESAMDGMFVVDKQGNFIDVNAAGCSLFGYAREEVLSSDVKLLVFPDRYHMIEAHDDLWKKGGFLPKVRLMKKDGSGIWVDLSVVPFRVGEKDLILGVTRDVTAQKKAEEALRESEERFRLIFEQNQDAQIILASGECRVLDANPAAVALFGYSKEELMKTGHYSLFDGHDKCDAIKNDLCSGSRFLIDKAEAMKKDGTMVTVSIRGQVIKLRENSVVLCTVRDLTEAIRVEEEARYIQSKLIHANKMTSIGTLASGVAHEINNPNNFILFNSTLLSDAWKDAVKIMNEYYAENGDFSLGGLPYSEMSEVIPELLDGISDGSRRIKGIVDSLKDFSRNEKAGFDGEIDINRSVRAAVSMLSTQILKYTDSFELSCSDGVPPVKGSSQKIEQVMINLVLNALHSLPDKKKKVNVSTAYDADANHVVIKVTDEGAGMSQEVLTRIMEPFYTTKSDRGGTGLGLSISYGIIKDHGGSLEFDSAPGRGTTVTIKLPALANGK